MRKFLLFAAILSTVSACGGGTWMGEENKAKLQGTRISILAHEQILKPETATDASDIKIPESYTNEAWAQVGGNSNHVMHNLKADDNIKKVWSSSAGKGSNKRSNLLSEPVVANGTIFSIDSKATVYALDAETGRKKWNTKLKPLNEKDDSTIRGGGIAYSNNLVFASTGFADVIALNEKNGKEAWRTSLSSPIRTAPTAINNQIFVIDVNNTITSLSSTDGHILWNYVAGSKKTNILGGASPAVKNNVVIASLSTGEIIALRATSGSQLWMDALTARKRQDAISDIATIKGRTAINGRIAHTISHGGLMIATDMRNGRRVWEREIGGINQPWISGDYLYVISNENDMIAIKSMTGQIAWITHLPKWQNEEKQEKRIMWTGPIMVQDKLIITGTNGKIAFYSPQSGELISDKKIASSISLPPVVANETIFFMTDDAKIVAYK
ncbi:MAG: PQQ-binding-like beta-propeller repeat protein [Alphaproteobacteria bacterium]|nr:PQQ-binding-like beta-propeller repeat protein [Alphaproteobacteria bacterium]